MIVAKIGRNCVIGKSKILFLLRNSYFTIPTSQLKSSKTFAKHSPKAFVEDILNKNLFAPQIFFYLCLHRISNLKWYQPSEDTTVVKQYGPQAKNKRINPFLDRGTKKFNV